MKSLFTHRSFVIDRFGRYGLMSMCWIMMETWWTQQALLPYLHSHTLGGLTSLFRDERLLWWVLKPQNGFIWQVISFVLVVYSIIFFVFGAVQCWGERSNSSEHLSHAHMCQLCFLPAGVRNITCTQSRHWIDFAILQAIRKMNSLQFTYWKFYYVLSCVWTCFCSIQAVVYSNC